MTKTTVATALTLTTAFTFPLAGCSSESAGVDARSQPAAAADGLVNVYWANLGNRRAAMNHASVPRSEVDAMLAARRAGKGAPVAADKAAGSLGVSRQGITTGSTDWANACVSYEWFLVTSGSDGGGDIFCAHYDAPFSHDGIEMPFVPAWYDSSSVAYFSLCTAAGECFIGDNNCPFTTNTLSLSPGYDGGAGNNVSLPSNVLFINGQAAPMTCINNLAGLDAVRNNLGGSYVLAADISLNGSEPPLVPIGSPFDQFHGIFNGNGFTITNLRIGTDASWYTGLFSGTSGATLSEIRLENVTVVGGGFTGAITGIMSNTTLTDSYVTGTVSGEADGVGMVVGQAGDFTDIERCSVTGTITGPISTVGGLVGAVGTSGFDDANGVGPVAKIKEIFTAVNVNPTVTGYPITAGGLIGEVEGADIEDINVVGPVLGQGMVGGVVGYAVNDDPNSQATQLLDALSRGSVTDARGYDPAGPVGALSGDFQRCDAFYELEADSGTPIPTSDVFCNAGFSSSDLRAPHPGPDPLMYPFTIGQVVTQDAINAGYYDQCKLGSGSDRDWGFGTCDTVQTWDLNSSYEHITLTRVPDPWIQPR